MAGSPFNFANLNQNLVNTGNSLNQSIRSNTQTITSNLQNNVVLTAVNRVIPSQVKYPGTALNNILASIPQNPLNQALKNIAGVDVTGMNPLGIQGKIKIYIGLLQASIFNTLKQCLYNSLRSLIYRTLDTLNLNRIPSINDFLNFEIRIGRELDRIRQKTEHLIDEFLHKLHLNKLSDFELARMQVQLQSNLNKICHNLEPKDKKGLSLNNSSVDIFAAQVSDKIVNEFTKSVTQQKSGHLIASSTDFFTTSGNIQNTGFTNLINPVKTITNDLDKVVSDINLALTGTSQVRTLVVKA